MQVGCLSRLPPDLASARPGLPALDLPLSYAQRIQELQVMHQGQSRERFENNNAKRDTRAAQHVRAEGAGNPMLRPSLLALLVSAAVAVMVVDPSDARAQSAPTPEARQSFSIPAQPLLNALKEFGRQTQLQVLFDDALIEGRQSAAVSGDLSARAALTRLLAGTGLAAVSTQPGTFTIRAESPESSTATLGTITVSGKAPGSTTEGTGSYTTFSTSSSTRLNLSQQETPQSVTVVTRQRMDDQKLSTVVEALDATTGVIVQQTTVGQDGPTIYVRGQVLQNYQIDGVPVFSSMSPFLSNTAAFDRIEIVRGATGIMNGLGTPAATVNMIRKRPTAEPQVEITTEAGSWNRHGTGLDVSGALNENKSLRGRLVADYKHQNAWVDRFKQKSVTLYGIGELDLGPDTLLTAGFSHLSQDSNSAIQGRPLYFDDGTRTSLTPANNTSQPWRYYDHETSTVFGSVEHRFDRGWVAKAEYSHTRYHYDGKVASIWSATDMSGNGSRIYPSHWNSKPRQDNLDTYVTGAFPLFGRTHEVIAGVTLSRLKAESPSYTRDSNYSTSINYYDWINAPEPTFTQTGSSNQRERQANAFLSTRLSVTDATSVLLGGRFTHWKLDGGDSTGYTYKQKENVFIPYVGVVHALNDTWSIYGSYTKIFQPQDHGIFDYFESPPDPEEGIGYEAGVKASFYEGRLTSSLSIFQTDLKNTAVWNVDTASYELQDKSKTRGLEVELTGELAKNWQLTAGYAFSQSEDETGQRVLTYVPRQSLKIFTSYRLPGEWNRLTLGGGVNWQSSVQTTDLAIEHKEGSVALVNLMARYEVSKNLSVSLNLNNALNKQYFSTISNNYGTYGAPRNFMVSAKYRF